MTVVHRSPRWALLLFVIVGLAALPCGPAIAQCPTGIGMMTGPLPNCGGATGMRNNLFVGGGQSCTAGMGMNVANCQRSVTSAVTTLFATHCSASALPAVCSFVCNCGTVVFDGTTGLPVELMDFAVESDAGAEGDGVEAAETR